MNAMVSLTHNTIVQSISITFISICSITGFLSVTTSLFDVLTDGLKREKHGKQRIFVALLALLPPMLIVILYPSIFTHALAYAGKCCLYVLVILPIAMFAKQRYWRKVA